MSLAFTLSAGLAAWLLAAPADEGRPTVAVLALEAKTGLTPATAELLTDYIVDEVRKTGAFSRVVSSKEIETLLGFERQKQLLDCDDSGCIAEIAGALGVDYVLTGSVGKLGRSALFNFRLLSARSGNAAASVSQTTCGEAEEYLVKLVRPAVRKLVSASNLSRKPVPALPFPPEDCEHAEAQRAGAGSTSGGAASWALMGTGGAVLGLGALGVVPTLALLFSSAGTLAAIYGSPEIRNTLAFGALGQDRFYVAHVPAIALAGASVVGALLALLLGVAGLAVLVGGFILR